MLKKKKKIKALVLLSGGLDSILTAKLLLKQGIEVTGICFVSYFFNAKLAQKAADYLKIKIKLVDISNKHLAVVKNPKYGYGKSMNPCLDCRILMLREAKKMMNFFDFIATGEVLGERPLSQNKNALKLTEEKSGLKGYLLRPLSAQLLEPTIPEKKGLVERKKLLSLKGRSRKEQISLAKKLRIKDYPNPAGGCLLTDLEFGKRLRELFSKWPDSGGEEIKLLKLGRHFWVENNKIIVGRNEEENEKIKKLSLKGDLIVEPKKFPGPTILVRTKPSRAMAKSVAEEKPKIGKESLEKIKELMFKYSPKLRNQY